MHLYTLHASSHSIGPPLLRCVLLVCRGKLAGKGPDEIEVLKKAEGVWEPQVRLPTGGTGSSCSCCWLEGRGMHEVRVHACCTT